MRVVDILSQESILPQLQGRTKTDVLRELAQHLSQHTPGVDAEQLVAVLLDRERLGTTAIGEGIAIPHGKLAGLKDVVAVFGLSPHGVDCSSLDCSFCWLRQRILPASTSRPWPGSLAS